MGKTIIISNRLPVKVSKSNGKFIFTQSEGGLATGLGSMHSTDETVWIGWPGIAVHTSEEEAEITRELADRRLVPVFLTEEDISEYYEGFSNDIIWPIFHYYASVHANYRQSNWEAYRCVNQKFLDVVERLSTSSEDTIWIHDYQLLLLPELIRNKFPSCTIGFFQHIPFPSFELFRLIPWRAELIAGMLGADLLGFHTFNDVRHFLDAATQLLPVSCSANALTFEGRLILAESFPMGIDSTGYSNLAISKEVQDQVDHVIKAHSSRRMILSIDRLDYSKGILQRLQAFELLLETHPEYVNEIILHMIVVPSRDTVPQYSQLKELIDRRVGEINARYRTIDWNPVHYFYRSFPLEELSALYVHADICMVTPMRDGMNLVSKEYVASRTRQDGVLILSEMAGASKELVDAVLVNPSNIASMRDAIVAGLNMPSGEQKRRMGLMQQVVKKFNVSHWTMLFMERLKEVKQMQNALYTRHITQVTSQAIKKVYQKATKRIIFLDYDGTLVNFSSEISTVIPDPELYDLLSKLCSDLHNNVVLISGRSRANIENWFGKLNMELIAEHGVWKKEDGEWESEAGMEDQWKHEIRPTLEAYVDRTPGAFIEEKDYSLVWHYRKVEAGLGELRTSELMNNLRYLTTDRGLQLLAGNKVVEVKNIEINKGKAASAKLRKMDYDFIMALGDDHTDEDIFKALPDTSVTIKVGSNISAARFYLRDPTAVRALLFEMLQPADFEQLL